MKRIKKLLPNDYYLDKNFMPLVDMIANELKSSTYYENIESDVIDDIVSDVLNAIKPKAKTGNNGKAIFY